MPGQLPTHGRSKSKIGPMFAGVSALALSLSACDKVPPESLRIATFNAALLSPPFRCANAFIPNALDCLEQSKEISEQWAEDLATRILANEENLDVIALNEVWDEDARKILVNRLSGSYPVQVRRVAKGLVDLDFSWAAPPIRLRLFGEDSGLMLFAKPEFNVVALPDPAMKWSGDATTAVFDALDASTPEVSYRHYQNCTKEDCLASKGIAMVRLSHRRGGIIYNIAFTHMQADPPNKPEEFASVRLGQFSEIRSFLLTNFPDLLTRLAGTESVLLLGDLNVPFLKRSGEWAGLFASPTTNFFSSPLSETWVTASHADDRTPTNSIETERLDYILLGPPPFTSQSTATNGIEGRRPCVQHVTVPQTFVRHASDHSMVHADINLGDFHCRPMHALQVDTNSPNDIVQSPSGAGDTIRLRNPGSIQWFFVPDRDIGTYSIGTNNPKQMTVQLFLPSNMSEPISRYNKTDGKGAPPRGDHGGQYSTDIWAIQGPFFIRVSGKDRFAKGDYSLAVRKHRCDTKATACFLMPTMPHEARLSAEGELNPQYEAWFRFDVAGAPTNGGPQQVTLEASLNDGAAMSAGLVDYQDPSGQPALAATTSATNPMRSWQGGAGTGTSGYIRIHQGRAGPAARTVSAKFDTSLRFLNVFDLVCEDETNPEFGSDDIFSIITIDGVQSFAPSNGSKQEFDCDDPRDVHDWGAAVGKGTIAYADKVFIRIYDYDSPSANDMLGSQELLSPLPGQAVRNGPPVEFTGEDGRYLLFYETRRRENAPVADP